MKLCKHCAKLKSRCAFSSDRRASDGLQSRCRECVATAWRARYAANPDLGRLRQREYNAKHRDKIRAISARMRKKHAATIAARKRTEYERLKNDAAFKERVRAYALQNKDKKREYDREYRSRNAKKLERMKAVWRAQNAELLKVIQLSYKARRRSQEKTGDPTSVIAAWVEEQEKVCKWCGIGCADGFHVDHVYPLARGGLHITSNLAIACPTCNLKKNAKDPIAFLREVERHRCDVAMLA